MNKYIYLVTVDVSFNGSRSIQKQQHAFSNPNEAKTKQLEYSEMYKSSEYEVYYVELKCLKVE